MTEQEKREKVIKGLEEFIADFKPFCGNKADWQRVYDALALLKAQEPVEPTEPDEDNMRYCGACGSPVGYEVLEAPGIEYVQYSYCPVCGRPVKWE